MLISLNWLTNYVDLSDKTTEEIEYSLTMIGFEVEGIKNTGLPDLPKVVVGEVLSHEQHPDADRLGVCRVNVGEEESLQIVCGASNYQVGDRVPVALVGARLPGNFKIKATKLRGVKSFGMMCSPRELGLGDDHEGLMILEDKPGIGTPINEVFTDSDTVFDIEVTPNRPDCLCHVGIAREIAAYFGKNLTYPKLDTDFDGIRKSGEPGLITGVEVTSPDDCPNYYAHSIRGVKIGASPDWLKRTLEAVDQRPINNVVDITNFVLLEFGQPLHAFDAKKIGGSKIVVRRAAKGEKIVTLDEKERTLKSDMLVIADLEKPLVIAGVMGSVDAEVDDNTVDVVLESAYFDPSGIRKTSRTLGLSSDSSYRFERGVDPNGANFAALRCIDLILEIAGGELIGPVIQAGSEPNIEREIELDPHYIRDIAGFDIPDTRIREIFEFLECPVSDGGEKWLVKVPSWRGDLYRPADLAEEVFRIFGTDKIPDADVSVKGLLQEDAATATLANRFSTYLVGQHFQECIHYSLRSGEEASRWFSRFSKETLKLANPFTSDQTHLRVSLVPGLLDTLKLNFARKTGLERVFEVGKVFYEQDGQVYEMISVAFVIFQPDRESKWKSREGADFYTTKNILNAVGNFADLNLEGFGYKSLDWGTSIWQKDHSAHVGNFADNGFEAKLGLLNVNLVKEWDLEGSVLAGSLDILPEKVSIEKDIVRFKPFSQFPSTEKDLALVVDDSLLAETVRLQLHKMAKRVVNNRYDVESVTVFDVYSGDGLPEGKKSLAFNMKFRSNDRTLTDKEVGEVFSEVQKQIEETTPYQVRS
ncbi:MAG: phenylalanine--tRNA ligase subunit beta [Verrucomicrobia bacterium]|nr:phenylalanine--tRNA ligase subunit beta [Verrucomicrobiota bacterium]